MSGSEAPRRRLSIFTVFGLSAAACIAVIGLMALVQATELFLDWLESRKLARGEAIIRSAEITTTSTPLGTIYEVVADYDVSWNGVLTRAALVTKYKSLTFDKTVAETRLHELLDSQQKLATLTCYLQPTEPEQAVLFLDFPSASLGIALMLGAGLAPAGIWMGMRLWSMQMRDWRAAALEYRLPRQPWIWDPSRIEGVCPLQRRWPLVIAACLAWNIPAAGLSLLMQLGNATQNPIVAAITPPALLIGLVIFAITMCVFWVLAKYGEPQLVVHPWPLMLGDHMECTLRFAEKVSWQRPLTVQLDVPSELVAAEGFECQSIEPQSVTICDNVARWTIPSPWRVETPVTNFNPDDYQVANWLIRVTDGSRFIGLSLTYSVLVYHCLPNTSESAKA